MRILIATTTSDRSETAAYIGLAARGHDVTMLCRPDAAEVPALRAGGVRVEPITIRGRVDLAAVRALRTHLAASPADVLYAPRNASISVALLATRGNPARIATYRGTIGHLSRLDPSSWMTYLHPRVHRIVCVSEAVRQYLLTLGLPPQRLLTVHKGHDVAWYDALPRLSRTALGLPEQAFLLGFTGRIRPVKGVVDLLDAMRELRPSLNVHLVLVGELADARVARILRRDAALRTRVHVLGFRRDAAAIAALFDAFAMPSVEREGLPRAVIEAMAQRVPPVVTRVGGMPELVIDGECGLIVAPRNVSGLSHAITTLAANLPRTRRLGEAARNRIISAFSIQQTIAGLEAALRAA